MVLHKTLRSPKRDNPSDRRSANLYHYYAGFSPDFVKDVLMSLNIDHNAIIMDPWNGSGTTTQVANDMGFSAIGFDINPVMVIVAKARLLNCTVPVRGKILDNLESIIRIASGFQHERFLNEEPLETWLEPESAICFRNIERAIQLQMVSNEYNSVYSQKNLTHISSMASFYYLAIFKTLRKFLSVYISSNPTWIKIPYNKDDYSHPTPNEVYTELRDQVHKMISVISLSGWDIGSNNSASIQIEQASSELIPLPNSSVDIVISSPPYCTRIDYAIATSPELALLGCSMNGDIKNLRDCMIGTPTILNRIPDIELGWGQTCSSFLNAVKSHNSKASKSYYYRYHIQYFDKIYRSLLEIDRVLVKSGQCILVVQDSFYKDIHNDLPKIFGEMAESLGWVSLDRLDFHIKRTMAGCNKKAKKYRDSSNATESVLIYKK